jgi:hypothetical protein
MARITFKLGGQGRSTIQEMEEIDHIADLVPIGHY